jgi:hypothetical protein
MLKKSTIINEKIMKSHGQFRIRILLFLLVSASMIQSRSADIPDAIINAIRTGNSETLAGYFNTSIEVAVQDKEDIYTKQQAALIIKDFFNRNIPSSFSVLHKGGKEGSQYAIGNLVTSGGSYRVTILVKLKDSKLLIHQLRFEKDGE